MSRVWLCLTRGPRRNSRSSEISPCSRRYDCERCGSRVNPFYTRFYQVACQRSCYAKTPRRGDDCRSFRHTVVQTIQPTPTKRAHTGGGARVCCSCTKGISGERSPSVLRWRCHIRTPRCAPWDERCLLLGQRLWNGDLWNNAVQFIVIRRFLGAQRTSTNGSVSISTRTALAEPWASWVISVRLPQAVAQYGKCDAYGGVAQVARARVS